MASNLIEKIAQKITVDWCRFTIVRNQDGFLMNEDENILHILH